MKFACESCRAQYMISDEKVGTRGVKFRCKRCNHTNIVRRAPTEAAAAVAPPIATDADLPSGTLEDEIGAAFDNVVSPEGDGEGPGDIHTDDGPVPNDARHLLEQPEVQHIFEKPRHEPAPVHPDRVEWFLAVGEQQQGPLQLADLQARWERAEIGPDTLCWREGLSDWLPVSQLPELAGSLAPHSRAEAELSQGSAPWKADSAETKEGSGWKPSAASALASLVQEEKEAASQEVPAPEATLGAGLPPVESTAVRSLLHDLPEPPPVEPSRVIPMSALPAAIAAASEAKAPAAAPGQPASNSRPASRARQAENKKKRGSAGLVAGIAAAVLVLGGVGAYAAGVFGGSAEGGGDPIAVAPAQKPTPAPIAPAGAAAPIAAADIVAADPVVPAAEVAGMAAGGEGGAEVPGTAGAAQGGGDGSAVAEAEGTDVQQSAVATVDAKEDENGEEGGVAKAAAALVAAKAAAPTPPAAPKAAPAPRRRTAPAPAAVPRKAAPAPALAKAVAAPKPARSRDLLGVGSTSSIDDLFDKEFSAPPPPAAKKTGSVGGTYIPPAPGGGGAKPKSLGQGDILGVVASHKGPLKTCATNYKSSSGQPSGTVVMRWSIKRDGKTTGVKPIKGAEHKELAGCIGNLVKGWTFPPYDGPQMAPIDFPFQF